MAISWRGVLSTAAGDRVVPFIPGASAGTTSRDRKLGRGRPHARHLAAWISPRGTWTRPRHGSASRKRSSAPISMIPALRWLWIRWPRSPTSAATSNRAAQYSSGGGDRRPQVRQSDADLPGPGRFRAGRYPVGAPERAIRSSARGSCSRAGSRVSLRSGRRNLMRGEHPRSADDPTRAVRLLAAATAIREALALDHFCHDEQYRRSLAASRDWLDAATYQAAWEQGRQSTWMRQSPKPGATRDSPPISSK